MATEDKSGWEDSEDEAGFVFTGKGGTVKLAEVISITSLRFERLSASSLENVIWVMKVITKMLMCYCN